MNKILTGDVWGHVAKKLKKKIEVSAAISYVTSISLPLKKGDNLICDGSPKAISSGVASAKSLKHYQHKGVNIYSVEGLHAKMLITMDSLVIGSANLSENSKSLVEASIYTTNKSAIAQAHAFISPFLIDTRFALDKAKIEKLLQIPVEKRKYSPNGKPKYRNREFGGDAWIITTRQLKDNKYNEEIEQTETEIATEKKTVIDSISTLIWPLKSVFVKGAKLGDIIIQKFKEKRNTYVYSPSVIVRITKKSDCVLYYIQYVKKCDYISWTKFERKLDKNIFSRQLVKNSNRRLNTDEYRHIEQILNKFK